MSLRAPALTVVASVGRAGDEPRDFEARLHRMLASLDDAATALPQGAVEAMLVDWNTPRDARPLREVLTPPRRLTMRVVVVPPELHRRAAQESGRQFLEGAAKNVGVVRSGAERVLVTNTDVSIRADLLEFCVGAPLGTDAFVRADRYDFRVPSSLETETPAARVFMAHVRHGASPTDEIHLPVAPGSASCTWPRSRPLAGEEAGAEIWGPPGGLPDHFMRGAHTNGAGDFVCVAKESFRAAGGWTEDPAIYHHGDALLVAQLLSIDLRQVIYDTPGALLHEDHPRVSEEERGGGMSTWPSFLEHLQDVVDGRWPSATRQAFGFEQDELPEDVIA